MLYTAAFFFDLNEYQLHFEATIKWHDFDRKISVNMLRG